MSSDVSDAALLAAAMNTLITSNLPVGLAVLDRDMRFVQINEILASANGPSVAAHLGRTLREVLPTAADAVEPLVREVLAGKPLRHIRIVAEVPSMPGEMSEWSATYLPVRRADGEVIGMLAHAVNHSLERRNERLEREGEQLRRVLDNLYVFVALLSPEGRVLEVNRAPLEAGGLTIGDVRDRRIWDTYWWSFDPNVQAWLQDVVKRSAAGEVVRNDIEVRMAGDHRVTFDLMMAPLRDDHGRISHLVASAMDISARVTAQNRLRDSEDRYRRVFEGSNLGNALVDNRGQVLLVNESLAQMFGYAREEMVGMPVHHLVPQRHRDAHVGQVESYLEQPDRRYMAQRGELFALRRDGSEFPVEIALNPLRDGDDSQVLATVNDVTERRAAQQQIESALREKTVLLNEIHHRVKNNLQVISSLLNLQSRNAEPGVQAALRDSQSRVRSMALMHQLLYERADFSALDLGPYLRRLSGLLRDTYLGGSSPVRLQVDAPDTGLRMDLQRAIPCGLLVTELVTNSIKHAFPNGAAGLIMVRVTVLSPGEACVDVMDDGIGMPAVAPRSKGLGFQLLPLLAEQCRSKLEPIVAESDSAAQGKGAHFRFQLQLDPLIQGDTDV